MKLTVDAAWIPIMSRSYLFGVGERFAYVEKEFLKQSYFAEIGIAIKKKLVF